MRAFCRDNRPWLLPQTCRRRHFCFRILTPGVSSRQTVEPFSDLNCRSCEHGVAKSTVASPCTRCPPSSRQGALLREPRRVSRRSSSRAGRYRLGRSRRERRCFHRSWLDRRGFCWCSASTPVCFLGGFRRYDRSVGCGHPSRARSCDCCRRVRCNSDGRVDWPWLRPRAHGCGEQGWPWTRRIRWLSGAGYQCLLCSVSSLGFRGCSSREPDISTECRRPSLAGPGLLCAPHSRPKRCSIRPCSVGCPIPAPLCHPESAGW